MPEQTKKNVIEARGRNGWFVPQEVSVSRYADRLAVGVASRSHGSSDPIYLTGSVKDMADLFHRIGDEIARLASCESGYSDIAVLPNHSKEK